MRLHYHSTFKLLFGTGLALSGATASVACGTKNLDGCEASRTCAPTSVTGSGGSKSEAGASDQDSHAASGGKSGSGGGVARAGQGGAAAQGGSAPNASAVGGTSGHSRNGEAGDDSEPSRDGEGGESDRPHPTGEGGKSGAPAAAGRSNGGAPSAAGAGGRVDAMGGMSGSSGMAGLAGTNAVPPGDTTAPQLTHVVPPDTATGVKSDTDVVLTFSEPMDTRSVEAAYQSNDLPPALVDFSWKNDSTMLVIHPKSPLAYADVTDLSANARRYAYTIAQTATDLAGNHLASLPGTTSVELEFTTLRHVTQALPVKSGGGLLATQPPTGTVTTVTRCDVAGSYLTAGDDAQNDAFLALATFDLSSVPSGVEWQSVTLTSSLSTSTLNPYIDGRLGDLHAFSTTIDPVMLTWSSSMTDLGAFGRYGSQTDAALDVRSAVVDDYAHRTERGNRSEYVFHFDVESDNNDAGSTARLNCANILLNLDYLAP